MNLNIKDRLIIPSLLPREGRLIEMQLAKSIIDAVHFTPQEISQFEIKDSLSGTTWNPKAAKEINIDFTPEQLTIIKKTIKAKDDAGEIIVDMLDTIKKFE